MIVAYIVLPILLGFISQFFLKAQKIIAYFCVGVLIFSWFFLPQGCEVVGNYDPILGIEVCLDWSNKIFILPVLGIFLSLINNKNLNSILLLNLASILGILLTNDFFNLFVWFELLIITSMILPLNQKIEFKALFKYAIFNILSGSIFLISIGLCYKYFGLLNLDAMRVYRPVPDLEVIFVLMFFLAMAIKSGIVPFHYWLGASYHNFNTEILPLYLSLFSKIAVVAFAKVINSINFEFNNVAGIIIQILSFLSLHAGFFLSSIEVNPLRSFAFFSISKSGFLFFISTLVPYETLLIYQAFDTLIGYFFIQALFNRANKILLYFYAFTWFGLPLSGFFFANLNLFIATDKPLLLAIVFIFQKLYLIIFAFKQIHNKFPTNQSSAKIQVLIFTVLIIYLSVIAFLKFDG